VKLSPEFPWQKQHSTTRSFLFYYHTELQFKEETSKMLHLEQSFVWKIDQKYLEDCEMLCWRRAEKISWTDHVRNE
jgi:hypothetical protein